ncbi:hypothetical protein JJL45_11710 [Tamlana sp. s12]|uniref:hypothetical protein n=1 Tax=Tamlana sp. s12 TaxID=1630406 RepID=UPI0007FCCF6F|nr:hypothetical protein [Tamlana sp. s12]OBQ45937.1 hypothetical protein VQ01_15715 [Tamlana sp. s12]QQY81585.1 hypothetical protein JJL45_11695 [Tamlana sp. s12]QQY81588.1 hypothetical protein JJL45_11710 [Tamlana sp. s12]
MSKYIIIILSIFIISCSNKQSNNKELITEKIDTLKYSYNGFNNGFDLLLFSNKKFEFIDYVYGCTGGGQNKKVFGEYKIDSTKLTLIPKNIKLLITPFDSFEFEGNTKKIETKYGPDSLKIKTKYNLINWGRHKYLLSEELALVGEEHINDFHRFSENYNSGYEPRNSGKYLKMVSEKVDTTGSELNLNNLPQKWKKLFLSKPIISLINKITTTTSKRDNELKIWKVEINRGIKDNVRKGMEFTDESGNFSLKIDSVGQKNSFGLAYVYDFEKNISIKKGSELRTKWK